MRRNDLGENVFLLLRHTGGQVDTLADTSLQQRLVKTGGRLVKHARYYWLLLAESHCSAAELNGKWQAVFKDPVTDAEKHSKHGRLALVEAEPGKFRMMETSKVPN
jgi:hypothetical protein